MSKAKSINQENVVPIVPGEDSLDLFMRISHLEKRKAKMNIFKAIFFTFLGTVALVTLLLTPNEVIAHAELILSEIQNELLSLFPFS